MTTREWAKLILSGMLRREMDFQHEIELIIFKTNYAGGASEAEFWRQVTLFRELARRYPNLLTLHDSIVYNAPDQSLIGMHYVTKEESGLICLQREVDVILGGQLEVPIGAFH